MRKFMRIIIALMIVLMASSVPAQADRGRHGHGHGRVGIGVFVGPGFWWPGWWGPYPYYPYYPPPVIVERPTDLYVQPPQAEETRYWYYCKESQSYYPAVKKCPGGWMKVVPPSEPPEQPEGEE